MPSLGLRLGLSRCKQNGASYDIATQALLDRASSEGDTPASGDTLLALDLLISSFRSSGVLSKLDAGWVFATNGDRNFAKYNIVNPGTYDCSENGTLVFTLLEGFTGNGSNGYLNTNFTPSTNGVNYELNSASFGYYASVLNTGTSAANMGTRTSVSPLSGLTYPSAGGEPSLLINTDNGTGITVGSNNDAGLRHFNRSGSSAIQKYVNGSLIGSNTNTSSELSVQQFYIFAINNGGTAVNFTTSKI